MQPSASDGNNKNMVTIAVAMSGGVDSAVAAALLTQQGHDVFGITLRLWSEEHGPGTMRENRCCSLESVQDARRVCDMLDIPHYIINVEETFKAHIVDHFIAEYAAGRTPNPCVRCNQYIKFDALLKRAIALGAGAIATGHYARTHANQDGAVDLLRGRDRQKDQSYALCRLSQSQLRHSIFPLGELTKAEVRQLAIEFDISIAEKPESQELCFVTAGSYRDFLRRQAPHGARAGEIRSVDGRVLGQHTGLIDYTIGQRKGLGIAASHPLYVTALDPLANVVIVGEAEHLERHHLIAGNMHYIRGVAPDEPLAVSVQVRAHAKEEYGTLHALANDQAKVVLERSLRGVAPGQALVVYAGERVVGAGILEASTGY
ncbi:MAG: tRNA 2-thiouridine(34) synthase MnmA [Chloroflexi bacterium]|nr:tRNA 2-thiouridine(34) synthase MnmA [Chloroflexota bacterium]